MVARNRDCDICGMHSEKSGQIKRFNLKCDVGTLLCENCWNKLMRYRKEKNKTLSKADKLKIRKFPK